MIEIKQLNKSYRIGQNTLHVLKGIDMKINEGAVAHVIFEPVEHTELICL